MHQKKKSQTSQLKLQMQEKHQLQHKKYNKPKQLTVIYTLVILYETKLKLKILWP
jgi:hypothetical protein